jgi:hypothetical protein
VDEAKHRYIEYISISIFAHERCLRGGSGIYLHSCLSSDPLAQPSLSLSLSLQLPAPVPAAAPSINQSSISPPAINHPSLLLAVGSICRRRSPARSRFAVRPASPSQLFSSSGPGRWKKASERLGVSLSVRPSAPPSLCLSPAPPLAPPLLGRPVTGQAPAGTCTLHEGRRALARTLAALARL